MGKGSPFRSGTGRRRRAGIAAGSGADHRITMRFTPFLSLVIMIAGSGFAMQTAPQDPVGYKSPYEMKVAPKELCHRQFSDLLLQTQRKMQLSAGITGTCKLAEIMAGISRDHADFDHRCPDFPAAKQAEAMNRANAEALRAECKRTTTALPPLPEAIIDGRGNPYRSTGCLMPRDGRQPTREEQAECIRKQREMGD